MNIREIELSREFGRRHEIDLKYFEDINKELKSRKIIVCHS